MIKVSIIVPVYNVEKYLEKCILSLVNQTLQDIEIILVNDGSPDDSRAIMERYKAQYPEKIICVYKENGGQGSARNVGLTYATGEYIGYVDSDDYVAADMYEKMYEEAVAENSELIICDNYTVDEAGKILAMETSDQGYASEIENAWYGKLAVWNKLFKRTLLVENEINFQEDIWYEDAPFTCKSILLAQHIRYVKEPLYYYLIREGSTMNNSKAVRNLEIRSAFDEIKLFMKQKNLETQYQELYMKLLVLHEYVATSVRVLVIPQVETKEIIQKLREHYDANVAEYGHVKDLSFLDKNKKLIYRLLRMRAYGLVKIIFGIKNR